MQLQTPLAFREASLLRIPPQARTGEFVARSSTAVEKPTPPHNRIRSALCLYSGSALLSLIIVFFAMQLWRADLHVPFNYTTDGQDSFINMMEAKTVIETGWNAHNPLLGAPGALDQLDFPNPEAIHWLAIRAISWTTHDFGLALNVYFLLTFPLTALATTRAARQIGLSAWTSLLVAQLYTFLPYHFMRGEMHLSLAGYYAIPLIVPAIIWIANGGKFSISGWITAVAGALLMGLSSPYYAAFSLLFLGVAGITGTVQRRDRRAFVASATLAMIVFAAFFAQIVPNLLHTARLGANPSAIERVPYEGDFYGLHLTQMLLPVPGHRIPALAAFRDDFAEHAPMVNENEFSALGMVGSWGLLLLLFHGIFGRRETDDLGPFGTPNPSAILGALAILVIAGVLVAEVGGLGPTLMYLGFNAIRGYNRISIFLGLFSLLAVGIVIDGLRGKLAHWRPALCLILLMLGLLDQISPRVVPRYQQAAAEFGSDADFVARMESSVPVGASIFQYPVMNYPESPPINRLGAYQLFRGYLHSGTLHWSFGAMKGREMSQWQRKVRSLPLSAALAEIRSHGFSGIYLDRTAYLDDSLERSIGSLLGQPMVSRDGRLVFFKLGSRPASGNDPK